MQTKTYRLTAYEFYITKFIYSFVSGRYEYIFAQLATNDHLVKVIN